MQGIRAILAGAVLMALAACDLALMVDPVAKPQGRPATLPAPDAGPSVRPTSVESAELRRYLAQVQSAQLGQGLLRTDGGGPDTPVTEAMVARNFERIAFYNEYSSGFSGVGGAQPLRRWTGPVRMAVTFGASVPGSERNRDTAEIANYAERLARVTGHPVRLGPPSAANFHIIIASTDDVQEALAEVAQRLPGNGGSSLARLGRLPREIYCGVQVYPSATDRNVYSHAVAIIRAENPGLLRRSCIHEELAQGLGLANDSPYARPSIFNDDDEFALLTSHDELLLRLLYDDRLRPGMSAAEARPIVREILDTAAAGPV